MARKLAKPEDWVEWKDADVVVGTPHVLSDGYPNVTRVPRDLFDLIIFDEAHHLPAYTWTQLHDAVDARAVLLTATPVRRDGKRLPGEIAFVYPLQRALDAKVYSPVHYMPVTPAAGEGKDQALAVKAKERLLSKAHADAGSRLLVRSDRRKDAVRLVDLYASIGVPLGLIIASSSDRSVQRMLKKLASGELLGLACVGSLTEGFDFPTLKVAAYHSPHRSLQPTLQFLGRLSRVTKITGELIADPRDLSRDTAALYRSDEAWSRLLPQIVDSAVQLERDTRRFIDNSHPTAGTVALPWLAVAPPRSVQIYRVAERPNLDMDPEALGRQPVIQRLYQPEHDLLAILTEERSRPRFATSTHLDGHNHRLHIAYWVSEQGLLFISTDRPSALAELLAKAGVTGAPLIGAADLRRLLAATNATRFFNVGLRELRPRQAFNASYETLAGAHADAAVGPEDIENKLLGHAMGRVGNGTGTFGISTAKGKYWEPARAASLFEFREWCAECARNVTTGAGSPTALHGLRIADRIVRYPKHPIAATLNESLLAGNWSLMLHQREIAPVDIDIHPERLNESQVRLTLIDGESPPAIVTANANGTFEAEPNAYALDLETGELTPLALRLQFAPPTIYFGDGSAVIGSASSTPKIEAGTDPPEFAVGLGWAGVNLAVETGDAGPGHINIQEFARRRAARDATWLITDHGTGELADLIAITMREGDATTIEFVHCKGTKKPPGGRVEDLYDVIGQALRSARHCREGESLWRELNKRLDSRTSTKVLEGDITTLKEALSRWSNGEAPVTSFKVTAAQPGLLLAETGTRASVRQLLFAANTHCFAQGIQLQLWCNDGT